jgi:hypothetical protein
MHAGLFGGGVPALAPSMGLPTASSADLVGRKLVKAKRR